MIGITCGQTSSMAVLENGEVREIHLLLTVRVGDTRCTVGATMETDSLVLATTSTNLTHNG